MKEFVEKQKFLKGLVVFAVASLIAAIIFFWLYYFEKPNGSKIHVAEYSQLVFDKSNCQSFRPTFDTWRKYFPLVLRYNTPAAYSSFQKDNGYYSAQIEISGVEAIYLTTEEGTIEIPSSGTVPVEIQAHTFRWDSEVTQSDFDSLRSLELERLYGYLTDQDDIDLYYDGIFDWMKPTSVDLTLGLCAQDLMFFPSHEAASFSDLNSIALTVTPDNSNYGEKTALLFELGDAISISIGGKSYRTGKEVQLRAILKNQFQSEGFNLVATGLSDKDIAICDSFTAVQPGYVCSRYGDVRGSSFAENFLNLSGNAQSITITSPVGWGEQRFIKNLIPEKTDQLTVSSRFNYVEIKQTQDKQGLELGGSRISAQANEIELFPSPWEKLPSELKVVWITIAASLFTGVVGFGIQRSMSVRRFWKWFITKPVYIPPVVLLDEAYIFQLINGKKISGIIETTEGRSTFRIFVLKEVREWDKDNWSDVLPTEVRVPQNQIEMYYKAHP